MRFRPDLSGKTRHDQIMMVQELKQTLNTNPEREKFFSRENGLTSTDLRPETEGADLGGNSMKKKKELRLGETLQRLMHEHNNMTIKELAYQSGVPAPTLAHFKQNRRPKDLESVQQVADCFGVTIHYLLFGEEEPRVAKLLKTDDTALDLFSGVFEVTVRRVKKRGDL